MDELTSTIAEAETHWGAVGTSNALKGGPGEKGGREKEGAARALAAHLTGR